MDPHLHVPPDRKIGTVESDERANGTAAGSRVPDAGELVAAMPLGLLVFDRGGVLLDYNPAATRLLDGLSVGRRCCCELFGCRTDGTALGAHCVTEQAGNGRPMSEVRIDLPGDREPGAVWVMGAPVDGDGSNVVVTLRPGWRRDRRARNDLFASTRGGLDVTTLGRTAVRGISGPLDGEWLRQRPGQIFKYLLMRRGELVPVDELAEVFWPGANESTVRNVRYFVHVLRNRLEPRGRKHGASSFLIAEPGGYRLERERLSIDADRFEALTAAGLAQAGRGDRDGAREALEEANGLYRGEFLADEPYADWAMNERNRLRELVAEGQRTLARLAVAAGDLDSASAHLKRVAAVDEFDLDVQRELLTVQLQRRRLSEAQRGYAALRARMRQRFGQEPDFTLADLAGAPARQRPGA